MNNITRIIYTLGIPFCLLLLGGCRQYYLSIAQEWLDASYLASSYVGTPDPRQDHPPLGQMLIVNWRVPSEIFNKKPEVVLDLILWDHTSKQVRIPIKHPMDFATFKLVNEEYLKSGGILTFKAEIITEDKEVFREWKHQLWVNLVAFDQEAEKAE